MNESDRLPEVIAHHVTRNDAKIAPLVSELLWQLSAEPSDGSAAAMASIQRHPLGFLACKWPLEPGRTLRVHIWNQTFDWTQEPDWQIHDHIFSFKSVVLEGVVLNKTYSIDVASSRSRRWPIFDVTYDGSVSTMARVDSRVRLRIDSSQLQSRGSIYGVESGVLHRSALRAQTAITVLTTDVTTSGSKARVVGNSEASAISFDRSSAHHPELIQELISAARRLMRA